MQKPQPDDFIIFLIRSVKKQHLVGYIKKMKQFTVFNRGNYILPFFSIEEVSFYQIRNKDREKCNIFKIMGKILIYNFVKGY